MFLSVYLLHLWSEGIKEDRKNTEILALYKYKINCGCMCFSVEKVKEFWGLGVTLGVEEKEREALESKRR